MDGYQRVYSVKLKTIGPVFIGSGKEITKKEYVFLENRKVVGVVQAEQLYAFLRKKGMANEFEKFLLYERCQDLRTWLREKGIEVRDILPFLKYRIPVGDLSMDRGRAKWQLMECIKDPYGMPFVPGSSLKGMLRTVLLTDKIQNGAVGDNERQRIQQAFRFTANRNVFLRRENKMVEDKAFHTLDRNKDKMEDAVNDELSGFVVSDSQPLSVKDLVLCQKVDRHVDGRENALNLLRECIRPKTEIHFTVTIDTTLCKVNKNDMERAVKSFSEVYRETFAEAFGDSDQIKDNAVLLGGGSGFVSKTAVYPLFGKAEGVKLTKEIFEKTGVPREHGHYEDERLGASPHTIKCTWADGRRYQMGLCEIEIM